MASNANGAAEVAAGAPEGDIWSQLCDIWSQVTTTLSNNPVTSFLQSDSLNNLTETNWAVILVTLAVIVPVIASVHKKCPKLSKCSFTFWGEVVRTAGGPFICQCCVCLRRPAWLEAEIQLNKENEAMNTLTEEAQDRIFAEWMARRLRIDRLAGQSVAGATVAAGANPTSSITMTPPAPDTSSSRAMPMAMATPGGDEENPFMGMPGAPLLPRQAGSRRRSTGAPSERR